MTYQPFDFSQDSAADGGAEPRETPASAGDRGGNGDRGGTGDRATPNLPALIAELPDDRQRAEQAKFTRAVQAVFLEALSRLGAVRGAAKAAGVSHQTAYRARRACAAFRRGWKAAMLSNRALAEDALACRAIEGVEEAVFYHGEEIARRRRYCSRLLLAHLARLDRLEQDEHTAALAEDFDTVLARFAAGEELPGPPEDHGTCSPAQAGASGGGSHPMEAPACAGAREGGHDQASVLRQAQHERGEGGRVANPSVRPEPVEGPTRNGEADPENSSPGQWSKRSMSPDLDPPLDPAIAHLAAPAFWSREIARDPSHYDAAWFARLHAMLAARPADAPPFEELGELSNGKCTRQSLRACLYEQVLAHRYEEEQWWWIDHRGRYLGEDAAEGEDPF